MNTRSSRPDRGFTLAELLIVMTVLGVISAIFTTSVVSAMGVDRRTKDRATVTENLTVANERMTREIRTAAPLISISDTEIVVESWSNGQRQRHTFTYNYAESEVVQTVDSYPNAASMAPSSSVTRVIARQVDIPSGTAMFVGHAKNGANTTVPNDVVSVTVSLVGQPAESAAIPVSTTIFLRNHQE